MDLLAREGEKVIWKRGHWLVEMRPRVSLRWHSPPDICLPLNNTPDRAAEWWPPGRLTLQSVPRWVTSQRFLSPRLSTPTSSFHTSPGLSLACQYTSICLMGPSEELTADTLVSLFPAAILLESAAVISHAAEKPFRLRHLRHPLSPPPHRSASLQERKLWLKITFSSTAVPGHRHFPMISC